MVIDTSAFLAILQDEPDRTSFTKAIAAAAVRRTSAASFLEASIVLESRQGADGVRLLDLLIESAGIEVVAVDFAQAKIARRAFAHFGKGRHPATRQPVVCRTGFPPADRIQASVAMPRRVSNGGFAFHVRPWNLLVVAARFWRMSSTLGCQSRR